MDLQAKNVVVECTKASDEERVAFPEVVSRLMEIGLERYHADLVLSQKAYYMPDGAAEIVHGMPVKSAPAQVFDAAGVEKAVRAIQGGAIKYREFCERIAAAGCVGYFVSLAGRRAVYYGRTGDSYVEWFPGAKP
jgi:uncharacterized protein YbcV (DUF1398 family)